MTAAKPKADTMDSADFIRSVRRVLAHLAQVSRSDEIYSFTVESWFDTKWIGFSNKVLGAFGVADRTDLVLPPFVPNRIRSEAVYRRDVDGEFRIRHVDRPLHIRQTSAANASRRLSTHWPNSSFLWWSANSARNGRGSIMAYAYTPNGHVPWYLALAGPTRWRVTRAVGLGSKEVENTLSLDLADKALAFTSSINAFNSKSVVL